MIKINCKTLTQVLNKIRRCLSLQKNSYRTATLTTTNDSTSVRVTLDDASLTCIMPRGGKPDSIRLPLHALCSIKPSGSHDIEFNRSQDKAYIRFQEAGVPTELPVALAPVVGVPPEAEWLTSNDKSLGTTLVEAAKCTDGESTRYSLGCLRLRGSDGQIAATDGRQAFIASGFTFPADELLIPAEPLSKYDLLTRCSGISVGRSADWFTIMAAVSPFCWRLDLRIMSKARFPNVDQCMPGLSSSRFELHIDDADAVYLLGEQDSLRGTQELDCVTLDLEKSLNGKRVCIRSRVTQGNQTRIAEHELSRSTYTGGSTRVAFDPRYLLNALRLGFRKFHLQSTSMMPIFCHEGHRRFVWTSMHDSMILLPSASQNNLCSIDQASVA
jgi:hypothetical protein